MCELKQGLFFFSFPSVLLPHQENHLRKKKRKKKKKYLVKEKKKEEEEEDPQELVAQVCSSSGGVRPRFAGPGFGRQHAASPTGGQGRPSSTNQTILFPSSSSSCLQLSLLSLVFLFFSLFLNIFLGGVLCVFSSPSSSSLYFPNVRHHQFTLQSRVSIRWIIHRVCRTRRTVRQRAFCFSFSSSNRLWLRPARALFSYCYCLAVKDCQYIMTVYRCSARVLVSSSRRRRRKKHSWGTDEKKKGKKTLTGCKREERQRRRRRRRRKRFRSVRVI